MRRKTIDALIEMGMPADIKGFHYIVDVMELFEDVEMRLGKTMVIYNEIAKKNKTTASKVERAIRHAFGTVISRGNSENVEKYLTLQNTTNGNLLHILYLRLTQED